VLFNLAAALYEPGDEVLIPAPYWVSYPEQVRMMGATAITLETSEADGFRLRPETLAAAVTPRTKALILCTPSNPTGSAYDKASLEALAEVLLKGDYYVIVDEIYADLVYDGFEHHSLGKLLPELGDRLIIVDGVSKSYAMTGWRIGWSLSSPKLAQQLTTLQGQSTTNPAAVAQAAAVAALNGPRGSVVAMREAFERRRKLMVDGLNTIPGISCRTPEGAFYAFANVGGLIGKSFAGKPLANDQQVAEFFLTEAHAATVAGTPFGAPGFVRLSYACSDADILEGLEAIRGAVRQLT
jgi:aspartate aminotransferase